MKLLRVLLNGLLVSLPLAVLVSGCGGSSNGPTTPTATPGATSTPTATGTITPLPIQDVAPIQFKLSDGRSVTLRLQTQGRRVFGFVETPLATTTAARQTKVTLPSIPLKWDGGNYAVDGSFTPPLSINLTGEVRQNGTNVPFVFQGTLPTQTTTGTFTLKVAGITVNVTVPTTTELTATATPIPTATPNA